MFEGESGERERFEGSIQYAVDFGQEDAVVGHWDAGVGGDALPISHFAGVEHASATVDDQLIARHIRWKVLAACEPEIELAPYRLPQPAGDLHPAYIVCLLVVRAALGDQHAVADPQGLNRLRAREERLRVAPMSPGEVPNTL